MGRSKVVFRSANEDHHQSKSKKKRNGSSAENTEPLNTDQGSTDGKVALYHCNYCNKDISGTIRIKCVICPDFDLCVECFSVGAEVTPHKSNHPYRVMDNLSFPLLCPDWNADEEMLLLEGIEMYGFGNWNEVAEHVGTKTKSSCIDHYNTVYMNSPCFPLPDMSQVMGKSREELLAVAQGHADIKRETAGELKLKEESHNSARVKTEELKKENMAHQSSSSLTAGSGSSNNTFPGAVKKASMAKSNDEIKAEESQADRRIGEKKPRVSGEEGPSLTELSGYNSKRQEFEIEYDNDAEQLLADMEFNDTDTDIERELKLKVLHIYSKRLDERKRRKDFILERNLLHADTFLKNLPPDERELCERYRVFMRFHSKEAHEELLQSLLTDYRMVKRIEALQEARLAGCRTAAEANKYIELKFKNNGEAGPSGKVLQKTTHSRGETDGTAGVPASIQPGGKVSGTAIAGQPISNPSNEWDVSGFVGANLLSETEIRLCNQIRILPAHYLKMLHTLSTEIFKGNVKKKSDAHGLFKVDPNKVNRIYDMLVLKGIAQA